MTLTASFAARSGSLLRVGVLSAVAVATLAGCAPLIVGGALMGGSMVVIDRRSTGAQVDDQAIELKVANRIGDAVNSRGHIVVTSYNRMVLLTGEAQTENDKASAEAVAGRVDNVRSVVNELAVMAPSSISARSNDAILTSKVKATFVDAKDMHANAIKVLTERGTVYLMGRVTQREADRASDLASRISGVQKVVRVFEVVTEAELADKKPAPTK